MNSYPHRNRHSDVPIELYAQENVAARAASTHEVVSPVWHPKHESAPWAVGQDDSGRSTISALSEIPSKSTNFDPRKFLATVGEGRRVVAFPKKQTIFAQGDAADAVFYIQQGKVRLTVVSGVGKQATLRILRETEFFGEGSLAGQRLRTGSATAMTDCALLQIGKKAMIFALHREHTFSDLFVAYLLSRKIRYEEDLVDQLFNASEKRLARALLLLGHFGNEGVSETVIPTISQQTLAEMIGTTRARVSVFMNKFRKLGFVEYGGNGMQVNRSLLTTVLDD